ncbi:hypothetical protein IQ273_09600 [Nodosilinea sp. LEGE 07298]|uniref:hypothetical protein n=1 Tax=Nodosilinea sp. LEGE 07298 TaxID=2777970 RepID=UPI00188157B5|nr:hypothetical protein [Nodosilinea sp. LEGE 07298]MBE9109669.1 hypothetical protein [Nodosilinea sp. LEGE 07298]
MNVRAIIYIDAGLSLSLMVNDGAAIAVGFSFIMLAVAGPAQAASPAAVVVPAEVAPVQLAQNPLQQAELQRQTAALRYNQGNLVAAAALLEPALAAYLESNEPNQIQQTAAFLGLIYAELGAAAVDDNNSAVALEYYQQQIDTLAVGFNRAAEVAALVNAGRVALELGQTALAQDYLETGLSIAQEVGNPTLIQQVQALLGS